MSYSIWIKGDRKLTRRLFPDTATTEYFSEHTVMELQDLARKRGRVQGVWIGCSVSTAFAIIIPLLMR